MTWTLPVPVNTAIKRATSQKAPRRIFAPVVLPPTREGF